MRNKSLICKGTSLKRIFCKWYYCTFLNISIDNFIPWMSLWYFCTFFAKVRRTSGLCINLYWFNLLGFHDFLIVLCPFSVFTTLFRKSLWNARRFHEIFGMKSLFENRFLDSLKCILNWKREFWCSNSKTTLKKSSKPSRLNQSIR